MLFHIYDSNYFNCFKTLFAYTIIDLVSQDNETELLENLDFLISEKAYSRWEHYRQHLCCGRELLVHLADTAPGCTLV